MEVKQFTDLAANCTKEHTHDDPHKLGRNHFSEFKVHSTLLLRSRELVVAITISCAAGNYRSLVYLLEIVSVLNFHGDLLWVL